jgi:hypothetical protein
MNEALAKAAKISSRISKRFKAKGHIAASRAELVRYVPNAKMPRTAFLASLQQDVVIDASEKMRDEASLIAAWLRRNELLQQNITSQ